MQPAGPFLTASEAAKQLGVSIKALRLYEQRGLVVPQRSEIGWRAYGAGEMARAAEVAALRALGLSLAQVARVLCGDAQGLEPALATHQTVLESRARDLAATLAQVRELRASLAAGKAPTTSELTRLLQPAADISVAVDLPWPWGGERFELRGIKALTYIIGPLGSGKTRLAKCLAAEIPGAIFLGLDRLDDIDIALRLDADPTLKSRLDAVLLWLVEEGATVSPALVALLAGLHTESAAVVVVDMVEEGLDQATQEALIADLRRRGPDAKPLFLMTRSSAILDLALIGPDEAIILCPANHSPPSRVAPYPGAPGYEAVATCLASPEVRARTAGTIAWRPPMV